MHHSKWSALLALLLAACLCLSACAGKQDDPDNAELKLPEPAPADENQFIGEAFSGSQMEIALHYASEDSLSLGSMVRTVPVSRGDTPVQSVLNHLMSTAKLSDAAQAEILNVETAGGTVTVNLSLQTANRSQQDYLLLCASICNTLLELQEVSAVNILIGERSDSLCGLPLGVFTQAQDNIAALYAQTQTEAERFPSQGSFILKRNALLYYPAENAPFLVPEVRQLSFTTDNYAEAIIDALIDGPLVRSCSFSPIPENMDLLKSQPEIQITEKGERVICLDFDPALTTYLDFSGVQPWQLYGCMVLSLCSFVPEIDAVRVFIGGEAVSHCDMNGRSLSFADGLMRRQDFAPAIGSSVYLYFANEDGRLVRCEAALAQTQASSPLRLIQHCVAAQPPEGMMRVFPEGVRSTDILGVSVDGRTATVNLSASFYALCQSLTAQQERQLIYTMVNTLTQLEFVGAVAFRVEGRQIETLAHDIYLKTPLLPDQSLALLQ